MVATWRAFCRYLATQEVKDASTTGARHLIGFLTMLRDRGLSARSQARVLTTLRRFYRFLQREDALLAATRLPICSHQRLADRLPETPSRVQVEALLDVPDAATPSGRAIKP